MKKDINIGFVHLVVYGVDIDSWCKKYGLEPFIVPCFICGNDMLVNIPFIAKNRRGIISEPCRCGDDNVPFSYIDLNFDELNLNSLGVFHNVRGVRTLNSKPCLKLIDQ